MKLTKRILAFALMIASLFTFVACDQHEIEGKWEGKLDLNDFAENFIAQMDYEHLGIEYNLYAVIEMEFAEGEYTSKVNKEKLEKDLSSFFETCLRAHYDWLLKIEEFDGSYDSFLNLAIGDWDEFMANNMKAMDLEDSEESGEYTYSDGILILDGNDDEEIEVTDGEFTIKEDDIKIKYTKLED